MNIGSTKAPPATTVPAGTTLDDWKALVLSRFPTARFQWTPTGNVHASIGLRRVGTWLDSEHMDSWVRDLP